MRIRQPVGLHHPVTQKVHGSSFITLIFFYNKFFQSISFILRALFTPTRRNAERKEALE